MLFKIITVLKNGNKNFHKILQTARNSELVINLLAKHKNQQQTKYKMKEKKTKKIHMQNCPVAKP